LADAVCGAVFGAISHTPRNINQEVEIHTFRDRPKRDEFEPLPPNVIQYKPMPEDVREYLDNMGMI